jgi:hypothetical protein
MSPERINAAHISEQLRNNIPPCQYMDENEILELAKRSRYFTHSGEYGDIFTFYFVAKKNGNEFGVILQFDRRVRTLVPNARHLKTL